MSSPKEANVQPQADGIIISTGPVEYITASNGLIATFVVITQQQEIAEIVNVQGALGGRPMVRQAMAHQ